MSYYEPAAFSKRLSAYLIDAGIVWVPFFILDENNIEGGLAILYFILLLVLFVYVFAKDGFFNGQSLGKKIMKLAVVYYHDQSKRIGFGQAIPRNLAFLVPFALVIMVFQIH